MVLGGLPSVHPSLSIDLWSLDFSPKLDAGKYSLAALTPELIAKYRDDRLSGLDRKDSKGKPFPKDSVFSWKLCDYLDFELEAVKPGYADTGQRGIGGIAPIVRHDLPNALEILLGVHYEHRHVDYVVKAAPGCLQHSVQVSEGEADLRFQIGLWRAICAAAHLARDE